jgi:hypothetical protein
MDFQNLKNAIPPIGTEILLSIDSHYHVGILDNFGMINVQGWTPTGIYTKDIFWCLITK